MDIGYGYRAVKRLQNRKAISAPAPQQNRDEMNRRKSFISSLLCVLMMSLNYRKSLSWLWKGSFSRIQSLSHQKSPWHSSPAFRSRQLSNNEDEDVSSRPIISKKFVPVPFQYHEMVDLVIEDITNLGLGVGRVTLPDGNKWVVMVPNVITGERVKAKIYKNFDSYSEGDLVEVVQSSPDRVNPPCPFFNTCGGCQYQHMTVSSQRKWKKSHVLTVLRRIGQISIEDEQVNEVIGTEDYYGYRTKLTPHYNTPRANQPLNIGFQIKGTRSIVDIDQCIIASPAINKKYAIEREKVKESVRIKPPKKGATLLFREADGEYVETDMRKNIRITVQGLAFHVKAGEFFQNNPRVLPLMVNHVVAQAMGEKDCKNMLDTYCGSGLFALSAAQHFQAVYGVEVSELAIQSAKENAKMNRIKNVEFVQGSSSEIFEKVSHLKGEESVVVIDPPRKGCDEQFLAQLFSFKPKRLVYISCDPATQARDTKSIVGAGYRILNVTPFDLFPQTRHIENVMTFSL